MPLLDHFRPPLHGQRRWEGFHGRWAAALSDALNASLPEGYFAEFQVTLGARIEVDVATVDGGPGLEAPSVNGVATAVQTQVWAPPAPAVVVPAVFPDDFEVRVFSDLGGPTLVGTIELVSPRTKDRPEARNAFTAKCAAYLQRGIGLVMVDVVTTHHANLHDELGTLLGHAAGFAFPTPTALYATAYRPAHRQERNELDVWREPLALGQALPTLPLAVRGLGCLPTNLEAAYTEARQRGRLG